MSASAVILIAPVSVSALLAMTLLPEAASAQNTQTLAQCISDLRSAYIYGENAATRCFNLLQTQPPTQTLGQCIEDMRSAYVYGENAADFCERLLIAQSAHSGFGGGNSGSSRPQATRSFQVVNNSGSEIYYLYASPAGQNAWSNDVLGSSTLPNGQLWNLSLSRGCQYDFQAETSTGSTVMWRNIEVCNRNSITLNP